MKNLILLIVTIFFVFHGSAIFAADSEIDSIRLKKVQDALKESGLKKYY